jgi:hypothetical protein
MKGVVPEHLRERFAYLDALQASKPPSPWRQQPVVHVGGLWHLGFGDCSDLLLLISVSGRGVVSCSSGEKLDRDDAEYYPNPGALEAKGIGPLDGQVVRIAGSAGGGLPRVTEDGWGLELHPLSWPDEELFLCPPGQTMLWQQPGVASSLIKLAPPISPLVAYGFSPTGKSLVVATSSDVTIFHRD